MLVFIHPAEYFFLFISLFIWIAILRSANLIQCTDFYFHIFHFNDLFDFHLKRKKDVDM